MTFRSTIAHTAVTGLSLYLETMYRLAPWRPQPEHELPDDALLAPASRWQSG